MITGTSNFTATGDLTNTNALLGALQNNGGPTLTRTLLTGSPAIAAGTNSGCPATDQRGTTRPQNTTCDIGAYELVVVTPTATPTNTPTSTPTFTPTPTYTLSATPTVGNTPTFTPTPTNTPTAAPI